MKLWALSLCGALVITSVFRLIISGSRLEKSVNVFLSVFIFFYSIIPLSNITEIDDLSFNFEVEEKEDEIYLDGYEMVVVESIKKFVMKTMFLLFLLILTHILMIKTNTLLMK